MEPSHHHKEVLSVCASPLNPNSERRSDGSVLDTQRFTVFRPMRVAFASISATDDKSGIEQVHCLFHLVKGCIRSDQAFAVSLLSRRDLGLLVTRRTDAARSLTPDG